MKMRLNTDVAPMPMRKHLIAESNIGIRLIFRRTECSFGFPASMKKYATIRNTAKTTNEADKSKAIRLNAVYISGFAASVYEFIMHGPAAIMNHTKSDEPSMLIANRLVRIPNTTKKKPVIKRIQLSKLTHFNFVRKGTSSGITKLHVNPFLHSISYNFPFS